MLLLAAPTHAATFNVNSTADQPDFDPTANTVCETAAGNGVCTLRAAIDQANADNTDSTINLPAGTYTLTGARNDDMNASGDFDVNSRGMLITIAGAGARSTIIDGNDADRVFHVLIRSRLALRGVTVTGGLANDAESDGGGIYMDENSAGLSLADSTVRDNVARNDNGLFIADGDGGGIHTGESSAVTISGSTIVGNTAADDGGGIENEATSLSITNSTIHGNRALGEADAQFAGDDLGNGGGIEHNEGSMSIVHATITDNVADNNGGGVNVGQETAQQQVAPSATFRSTILSANQAPDTGPNCRPVAPATLTSAGTNLESGPDCGFTAGGDLQGANPQLGGLANNGGGTDTRALGPTSPALHRATTAPCPGTDQRGTTRPQGPACDIGAYERALQADAGVVIDDSPDPVTAGRNVTYRVLAGNAGPDPATNARVIIDLPSGIDVQSSSVAGGGSCSGASTLTCNLGDLAIGQRRLVTVVVRTSSESAESSEAARSAQAGGSLEAVARITATESDPDSSNNEARTTTSFEDADEDTEEADEGATAGVAGTGADDVSLASTGLPLLMIMAAGAWMFGAGTTLRLLVKTWD